LTLHLPGIYATFIAKVSNCCMMNCLMSVLALFLSVIPANNKNAIALDSSTDTVIYLFPGQGSDCRLFKYIEFPYDTVHMELPVPLKKTTLGQYAREFIPLIDTARPFILMGVSLGGMICSELADTLEPVKIIVISSAKCRQELPGRYRFQRSIPLNKILPKGMIKWGAKILAPMVEPARKLDKDFFHAMIDAKDPVYLKRTVDMVVNWDKGDYDNRIIHIHGDNDHTLPHRNIKYDYLIENGTHMLVYIRGEEINKLINKILR
jgi:pimeloyl-ACP methyl ester carboxylesterase